jgi:hypothetical protein
MPEIGTSGLTRAGEARKLAPPLLYPFRLVPFAFAAFYSLFPYVLSPIRAAWSAMVRSPTSFAGSAFHSLLFPKSTYSSQLTSPSLSFYEDQLDQCRGEPAQLAENKTLAPVRIERSNADHRGPPRPRQVLAREGFFTTRGLRDVSIFVLSARYPCRSTSGRRYL